MEAQKLWSFFVILTLAFEMTQSNENDTSTDTRSGRVSGRIVKLYSGVKKDPILCPKEGFVGDPIDCSVFYRCLKANNGKFTVFRFQCGPGTVYDPESEVCNHPQNTKRSECGGVNSLLDNNNKANEIEGSFHEIPYPLSTESPINTIPTAAKDTHAYFSNKIELSSYVPQEVTKPSSQKTDLRGTTPAQSSTVFFSRPMTSPIFYEPKNITQTGTSTIKENIKTNGLPSDVSTTTNRNMFEYKETFTMRNINNRGLCTTEGFMGDPVNCRKFYRCVSNLRGGYIRYEFLCNELTIWDDELGTCNHAWAVRSNRCGRDILNDINDVDSSNNLNDDKIKYSTQNQTSPHDPTVVNKLSQQQIPYGDKINYMQTPPESAQYGELLNDDWINRQKFPNENKKQTMAVAQTPSSISPDASQTQDHSNYNSINNMPIQNYIPNYSNQAYSTTKPSTIFDDSIKQQTSGYQVQNIDEKKQQHQPFSFNNKINHIPTSTTAQTLNVISMSRPTYAQSNYNTNPVPNYVPNYSSHELNKINNFTTLRPSTLSYEDIYNGNNNFVKQNQCSESGFVGDIEDCRKFYRCVDNGRRSFTRYEFTCGQGTVWDPTLEACNYEWAVKECGGKNKKYENDKITNNMNTSLYQTSSFSPVPIKDFGYDATNTNPYTTIKTKTTTIVQDDLNNKCLTSGFFGVENDCTMFYRCVSSSNGGFTKVFYKCDEGHLWDSNIKSCNRAELVKSCGPPSKNTVDNALPHITTSPVQSVSTDMLNQENNYDFAYGERITTARHIVTETYPSNSVSVLQNRNNECKKAGFMGDINDCRKFYRCVDNGDNSYIRYEFTCGDGTAWDSSIEACNHAWAVRSCAGSDFDTRSTLLTSSTKRQPETSTTSTSPQYEDGAYSSSNNIEMSIISNDDKDFTTSKSSSSFKTHCYKSGFMGDNNDCTKFYRCVDNGNGGFTQYQFSCGEGTVWDAKIEACNHKWAVEDCSSNNDIMKENITSTTDSVINTSQVSETHIYTEYTTTQKISTMQPETDNSDTDGKNICNEDGFMGDSNNCKKFYRCVSDGNGGYTRYEFSCGEGTVWDQKIQSCNHVSKDRPCTIKNNVSPSLDNNAIYTSTSFEENKPTKPSVEVNNPNLSSSVTETHQTTHEIADQQTYENECYSEGFFGNPNDCKKFYRCVNDGSDQYIKYEFSCGEGTAWDHRIQSCNHVDNVQDCQHAQTSETENSPVLENPMNDEQFPIQSNEESSTTHSPTNSSPLTTQQFNENIYTTKPPQQSSTSETSPDKNICTDEGFYGNEEDCTKFYRCVGNEKGGFTKYNFDCGEGTIWDQDIVACNHPQDVTNPSCKTNTDSESSSNNDVTSHEPSQTTSSDQSDEGATVTNAPHQQSSTIASTSESNKPQDQDVCEEEGFYGSKKDCKKFYRCVANQKGGFTKYNFDCGEGTIWDQDITACNHPQDVANPSCETTNNNSSSEENESEPVPQSTSTTSSIAPASADGSSSTTSTASSTSTSTDTSTQSTDTKPNYNYTCTKAGFFADPNDCKKFYRCVDWDNNGERFSVYHFECGEGTIWDPALETCNHEDSVYPPRNCSVQQESDNTSQTSTTTTEAQTTENMQETSTQQSTTQETTTETSTTMTTKKTSTEPTTEQSTTTQSSTSQSTTDQTTTQESSSSEMTTKTSTTDQTVTTEKSTTASQQTTTETSTTEKSTTSSQQTTTDASTTTEQSTTSSQTTTEPSTTTEKTTTTSQQTTTTSPQTTTEQTSTTTSEPTTEQTTQTEKTEDPSTTEKSTTQSTVTEEQSTTSQTSSTTETNQESSTQTSTGNECPETNDGENVYVCPTSFRRHPKYCNMFYQCTEDDDSHELKIATFQCPNNTIYDESKTQCVAEKKADKKCKGEIATKHRVKRLNPNFKEPITVTNEKLSCPSSGHYVFEKNQECSQAFLKCLSTKAGLLKGFVYRCPEGYTYWSISRRCEAVNNVRDCKHSHLEWSGRYEIPVEDMNIGPKILV